MPRKLPKVPRKSTGICIPAGKDPLSYMLAVMNDEAADLFRRDKMAVAAAPYVHVKKSADEEQNLKYRKRVGKKEFIAAMAESAGEGTEWGEDLQSEVAN